MDDRHERTGGRFGTLWLSIAVLLSVTMFALLGWNVFNTFQVGRQIQEDYIRGEQFRDRICLLHQEQSLSLAMLVATGGSAWEQRYETLERELYATIQLALQEQPPGYDLEALHRLEQIHERLRERATRSIELTRVDRAREGLGMLSAHKYEKTRQAFSDSINQFIQGYREFLSGLLASERTRQVAALAAAFLIFAISLAVWIVLVRRLDRRQRAYRQEILERRKAEEELSRLAGHLQSVREQERTAIAREVHDEMGQALAALKIDLVRLRNHIPSPPDDVRDLLQTMLGAITDTIDSVQRILSELRPSVLDYLGLVAAIEWQANEFQSHTGIECVLSVVTEDPDLERDEKTALFRILQESLTNVARHADATRVEIRFAVEHPWLVLSINDNGAGISEWDAHSGKSYGLMGMRERAHVFGGRLEIAGTSGQGTTVRVRIPIRSQAPDPEGLPA